jgi:hypothetical protein
MKYRYEGFTVGQRIRALDFAGRGDCYIEGRVTEVCRDGAPARDRRYAHYVIKVEREVFEGKEMAGKDSRVGDLRCVPMWSDHDHERVTVVSEPGDRLERPTSWMFRSGGLWYDFDSRSDVSYYKFLRVVYNYNATQAWARVKAGTSEPIP